MLLKDLTITAVLVQLSLTAAAFTEPVGHDVQQPLIRFTSAIPLLAWWLALIRNSSSLWLAGAFLFPLHVAVAFHLGHGWSHSAAMAHVEAVGGFGPGLFLSYAFGIVWLVDAVWKTGSSATFNHRPVWLHVAIHGFLAFMVFNATVVFGSWPARIVGVLLFGTLGVRWRFK